MKSVVLASLLGAVSGAFVLPHVGGPVHYQVTRAHALYGELPATTAGVVSVSLGTLPVDFVLQDFVIGSDAILSSFVLTNAFVKVNGSRVLPSSRVPTGGNYMAPASTHLNGGVFIPAGSTFEVEAVLTAAITGSIPITLSGYVQ